MHKSFSSTQDPLHSLVQTLLLCSELHWFHCPADTKYYIENDRSKLGHKVCNTFDVFDTTFVFVLYLYRKWGQEADCRLSVSCLGQVCVNMMARTTSDIFHATTVFVFVFVFVFLFVYLTILTCITCDVFDTTIALHLTRQRCHIQKTVKILLPSLIPCQSEYKMNWSKFERNT